MENGSWPSSRRSILCVDDDPAMQELLVWHLQSAGFHPRAVSSGRDALRLAESELVDLFVFDYQMSEMNGAELAAELRRLVPRVPLLMISGNGAPPSSALDLVDRFVAKNDEFAARLVMEAAYLLAISSAA